MLQARRIQEYGSPDGKMNRHGLHGNQTTIEWLLNGKFERTENYRNNNGN